MTVGSTVPAPAAPAAPSWPEIVADVLELDGVRPELQPLATGKFNTSYRVDWPGGRALLRIAPPDDVGQLPSSLRFPSGHVAVAARQRTSAAVDRLAAAAASACAACPSSGASVSRPGASVTTAD